MIWRKFQLVYTKIVVIVYSRYILQSKRFYHHAHFHFWGFTLMTHDSFGHLQTLCKHGLSLSARYRWVWMETLQLASERWKNKTKQNKQNRKNKNKQTNKTKRLAFEYESMAALSIKLGRSNDDLDAAAKCWSRNGILPQLYVVIRS